jgi:hypothetical protein
MAMPLVRTNASGEREHLTQDGWIRVNHGSAPSIPIAASSRLTLEEPLELPPDVSPEILIGDGLALAVGRAATPFLVVLLHDVPPSEGKAATLDFAGLRNVDR